ncbi:hypothetical protein I5U86_00430 [Stenotrophomonas maltophilia]|nr:hypothetical protein [Stenotrophomonas maltophilia]MBH1706223.1 hypothetical protein [Stenotrophomonas maltophilia]MBH1847021.1 hypothetical protein [Stenotrophomonas maltophilia]
MSQLPLPMTAAQCLQHVVVPALAVLGAARYDSPEARVMLLAISGQESGLKVRRQQPGPARGLWQFEQGGGVRGVLNHPSTRAAAALLCGARGVTATPAAVYAQLEQDDILAAGFARLLLFTLPKRLPPIGNVSVAWAQYLDAWRPGKPHIDRWPRNYRAAVEAVRA